MFLNTLLYSCISALDKVLEHEHAWPTNENEVRAPLPVKREVLYDSGLLYGYVILVLHEV